METPELALSGARPASVGDTDGSSEARQPLYQLPKALCAAWPRCRLQHQLTLLLPISLLFLSLHLLPPLAPSPVLSSPCLPAFSSLDIFFPALALANPLPGGSLAAPLSPSSPPANPLAEGVSLSSLSQLRLPILLAAVCWSLPLPPFPADQVWLSAPLHPQFPACLHSGPAKIFPPSHLAQLPTAALP